MTFNVRADSRAAASAQAAYGADAEQVEEAFRRRLAGEKSTTSDVKGSCNANLNAR